MPLRPDGRILYWVDTLGGTVEACDVADDGTLGPSRPFVTIDPADGTPDGPSVD
ncbi:MAG TPA: SMP-30/gluconolactonase/LRE family protein, partial [Allosphingosinicella sp.]